MTHIVYDAEKGILKASGHAGYAEAGKDIVCASVSALTQAAAVSAQLHGGEALCDHGAIYTRCEDPKHKEVLRVLAVVLNEMAWQYPAHVKMVNGEG